jgi:hypothetical protein
MGRLLLSLGLMIDYGQSTGAPSFAVVMHRLNPNTNLRFADVQAYFAGAVKRWPNGSKVVLVERTPDSAAYQFLLSRILHMSAAEYRRRLISIEFAGEAPVTLRILNSEEAACKFVFNVPGAIALIQANSLSAPECGDLEAARIDGRLPGQEGYRLQ